MILSGADIAARSGILTPWAEPGRYGGTSYGLSYAGYDLRLSSLRVPGDDTLYDFFLIPPGKFMLGATMERFSMPLDLLGIVHDKSTLARHGLSVFNTVIEPGWQGFLTLELVNHGPRPVELVQGMGIAQVVFHQLSSPANPYEGKYQNQESGPQEARYS